MQERLFDGVLQLAHVARPRMPLETTHHFRRDRQRFFVEFTIVNLDEMIDQERQIFKPLSQGRKLDYKDVEAIVQILSKTAGGNLRFEVLIRGGNDADVRFDRFVPSQTLEMPFLKQAENLPLGGRTHVANLVQQEGPFLSLLEFADASPVGSRKCPAFVAKQLTFEQGLLKSGEFRAKKGPSLRWLC